MKSLTVALVLSIGLCGAVAARADVPPAYPPAATDVSPTATAAKAAPATPDSDGFVPVKEGELAASEQLPANKLVAAAYGFILACLIVWIASVAVRARKVEEELVALRAKIGKAS